MHPKKRDLGAATVGTDGTSVFTDGVGANTQGLLTATVTSQSLFRVDGGDHDTLSFEGSALCGTPAGQLAAVIDHARDTKFGLVITDPATRETVRIGDVKISDLVQNQRDITFHA